MNFSYFVLLVQVLVLSVLALSSQSLPQFKFSPFDSPDFCSQIITPTCNTTFSYIDDVNKAIRPSMRDLIKTSYFRYFKVNSVSYTHLDVYKRQEVFWLCIGGF